ncbi:MAG: dienelactone hydrolase family protein [Terriglobales bacterium]|jgi:dienelactone hydrolase
MLFPASVTAAQAPLPWRYDLRPGDHLIYRYSYQRQMHDKEDSSRVEARFQTQVLVVRADPEQITLGFQRNRQTAAMTEYSSKGKDRLAKEIPNFEERMKKRRSRFSEAMEISPTGKPRYSWEIARESSSHILGALHEVMPLPPVAVAKGDAWRDSTVPGLDFRWVDDESIRGTLCHRVEAEMPDGSLKLSYWWSPESGVLEQVVLDGNYSLYGSTVHETARMELESRVRGEPIAGWLDSADTRQGALQALLVSPGSGISSEQLAKVLASDEPASEALALALVSQRKIELSSEVLGKLRQSARTELVETQLGLLAAHANSGDAPPFIDQCHRALPLKSPSPKFGTTVEVAATGKDDPQISYFLRTPLSYREDRPSPLLVYLSGGAGFAIDGVNTAEDVVSDTGYLVLYPHAAAYWWSPEVTRRFDAVFKDVVERYNVDRDRIYITGFSNGGTGAVYYATLWPQRFAAVVSLMGAGQCNQQIKAGLVNLRNLPLLFVHGENDPIIAPDCSTSTHAALLELNPAFKPELKILAKHEHDITLQSDDGLTLAFFKNKIRNPFPRTVDLSESDAFAARAYWVEILDGKAGKSDVDVRVKPDNTIDIHSHDVKRIRLHLRAELLPKPGEFRIVWNGKKLFDGPLRDRCAMPVEQAGGDPELDRTDTRDLTLP